jgi:hypothetical protein
LFLEISISNRKARVPWAELQRAWDKYIAPKYLPMQVTIKQYYHLRQKDVNSILQHWVQRQATGMVPFDFKKVTKAIHQRNSDDANMGSSNKDEDL